MRTTRTVALALASTLALVGLAACGDSPNANQNRPTATVLNVGMPNGPQTENHNPFLTTSAARSLGYRWQIYEPLMMWNPVKPADPMKPWLATKAEWSTDYTSVKVTIRDNVKWSDGKPLTAEDVAFTYNLVKDNDALNDQGTPYTDVSVSGNVVTLTFDSPQFVNQQKVLFRVPIVPKHIWETISDPTTDINKNPVGSGPYTLKSFTPQTTTLSVRTGGYWQDLPQVKELRYTSYTDNNAQTTALANGESEWSFVFIPNYKTVFVDKDPANHKVWAPPVLGIHGLYINTTKKPFDNPALRKAMNMVINREDIFVQAEAAYFHPLVKSVTGLPSPAGDAFIAAGVQGQGPHGRRRGRQEAARRRRLQARGHHAQGPDRQAGHADPDRPGRLVRLPDQPRDREGQPVQDRHRGDRRQGQPGRVVQERRGRQLRGDLPVDRGRRHAVRHLPDHHGRCAAEADRHRLAGGQLRPLQQPGGDRGAEGVRGRDERRRPYHGDDHAAEGLRRPDADDPGRRGPGRRRVQHEELGRLARRRRTRTARCSPPSPTRWTWSCTSSPPVADPQHRVPGWPRPPGDAVPGSDWYRVTSVT